MSVCRARFQIVAPGNAVDDLLRRDPRRIALDLRVRIAAAPQNEFGGHIAIALSGIDGLNCTCTFRSALYERRRRCSAWRTMSPAMIAFVVAIAGMMFPAISVV